MKKLIVLFLLLPLLFITRQKIFAQTTDQNTSKDIVNVLTVSPIIIDTTISKDKNYSYEIKVKNGLDQPLGINASIQNFVPSDQDTLIQTNAKPSPLIKYSSLSQDNFIIDPKGTKSFNLKIQTPKDLKDGGYYEVVFLTPFFLKAQNPNSPTVLTQVGILYLGNAGKINYKDLQSKVKIPGFDVKDGKTLSAKISVENLYFNHFSAKPFVSLTPLFGKTKRIELTDKRILPGTSRVWDENLALKSSLIYRAQLAVSVGQGNYVYSNKFIILLPFGKLAALGISIFTLIFIIIRRKQLKRAIKVMISGK